jgi:hypothetical protein
MPVQRPRESAQSTHAFLTSSGAALGLGARFGRAPVGSARGSGYLGRQEGKGLEADANGQGRPEEDANGQGRPEEAVRFDGEGFPCGRFVGLVGEQVRTDQIGARRVGSS